MTKERKKSPNLHGEGAELSGPLGEGRLERPTALLGRRHLGPGRRASVETQGGVGVGPQRGLEAGHLARQKGGHDNRGAQTRR